jgi:hypothetical protein
MLLLTRLTSRFSQLQAFPVVNIDSCHPNPTSNSSENYFGLARFYNITMTEKKDDSCWDAFESDDDTGNGDDENKNEKPAPQDLNYPVQIATYLTQLFVRHNAQIQLGQRNVLVWLPHSENGESAYVSILSAIRERDIRVTTVQALEQIEEIPSTSCMDALVCLDPYCNGKTLKDVIDQVVCPGGTVILSRDLHYQRHDLHNPHRHHYCNLRQQEESVCILSKQLHLVLVARQVKAVRVHASTCPWLPSSHSIEEEEDRLHHATVCLSSYESVNHCLTASSIQKAVQSMQRHGYCVLPRLLNQTECLEWGHAVLESVHEAAQILLERDSVDIYHPQSSRSEPQSYQEMSMREDLRMDIRQGPGLSRIRHDKGDAKHGNQSVVITASSKDYNDEIFLRGHPGLLEIVRRTMNPRDESLYKGNIGRWNFGGSGSDGSFQDLRLSPVGGIVSLPGAADQAMHADTPHLFENIPDLPAHYINVFAPCTEFHDKVGGTAFVHGSHNLAFTARHCGDDTYSSDNSKVYPFLVRPCLTVGDVVLFDCRILHFGLANTSESTERCICYTNTWQNWFHDAKNWDMNRAIFEDKLESRVNNTQSAN